MLMRRQAWIVFAAALALAACEEETDGGPDAGTDAATQGDAGGGDAMDAGGGGDEDAATGEDDAGTGEGDAGTGEPDASTSDSGMSDSGMSDSGMSDSGVPTVPGPCGAAPITIQENCEAFTACGGTITADDFCYKGICIEERELLEPFSDCPGVSIETAAGLMAGRVSILTETHLRRQTAGYVDGTLAVPSFCAAVAGMSCVQLGETIEEMLPGGTASCVADGLICRCDVRFDMNVDETQPFSVDTDTGVLTIGTGASERTYDYCVDETEGSLRFRETTSGADFLEPGIQTLVPSSS